MSTGTVPKKSPLLLIGTQEDSAKVTRIILEKEGHQVDLALSPADGAAKVTAKEHAYRLCLLDHKADTPAEALFEALVAAGKPTEEGETSSPIPLLIIASSQEEGEATLSGSGLTGAVLVKPYDRDDLIDQVRQLAGAGK